MWLLMLFVTCDSDDQNYYYEIRMCYELGMMMLPRKVKELQHSTIMYSF